MTTIVNGRSGETILGTYEEAPASGSDATFSADKIDYGFGYTTGSTTVAAVNGNLGNNPTLGANLDVNSGRSTTSSAAARPAPTQSICRPPRALATPPIPVSASLA
jgi:hypothetical protein